MSKPKKVLVAPMDWGLGHATRCIPVINELREAGAEVVYASSGKALHLLKREFPELKGFGITGYNARYPGNNRMTISIAAQLPKFAKTIYYENRQISKLADTLKIDAIISDNRFGCRNARVYNVFISHQLFIKAHIGKPANDLLNKLNHAFISRFDECWIPDYEGDINLSGELSHLKETHFETQFIGPLSRFENKEWQLNGQEKIDVLAILSGPEPQRAMLEKQLIEQLKETTLKSVIVRGMTDKPYEVNKIGNITLINHAASGEIYELLKCSEILVARSGYSTIMDLAATGGRAILIPTPGQTEQEYLAKEVMKKGWFFTVEQQEFKLHDALVMAKGYNGIIQENNHSSNHLKKAVRRLMDKL